MTRLKSCSASSDQAIVCKRDALAATNGSPSRTESCFPKIPRQNATFTLGQDRFEHSPHDFWGTLILGAFS
jgi:hypothetical protein